MAKYGFKLITAVTVTGLLVFLTFVPKTGEGSSSVEERKKVLGSKPPGCINKCSSCRPCKATLVVPFHHQKKSFKASSHGNDDDNDGYYLLSWKCRCGNKFFEP